MSCLVVGKGARIAPASKDLFNYIELWQRIIQDENSRNCNSYCPSGGGQKVFNVNNLNPNIIKVQYAVRGPIVIRAAQIENELKKGDKKPFKKVIRVNIGDAHAMGQKPITFLRQVLACVSYPPIMEQAQFPEDVKTKAMAFLAACGGKSVGAYSASPGIELVRKNVAKFIECRDGHPCNFNDITIGGGASNVIKYVLEMFANNPGGKPSGILIPIPQYPLYSATIPLYGMTAVHYYLDEEHKWGLDVKELDRALHEGSKRSDVRAIVVINPGNPTGQVLSLENIQDVIKFAHHNKLFIFADEVYQANVYAQGSQFHSFKKVMFDMGPPYNLMELASFHSVSKGFTGECGLRGGWMEMINMDPEVVANVQKAISANLCSSILGQCMVDCLVKPPEQGEPSYDLFTKEKNAVLGTLKERATLIYEGFSKMKGFTINPVQGAMYAFPKFELSDSAVKAAEAAKMPPDTFYAFELLENTGICVVPGSGFGQIPGTHHFRTTILAPTEMLKEMLTIFQQFQEDFTKKYA